MLVSRKLAGWTAIFLAFTVLTSITGFPIPPFGIDPPRVIGIISLVLLAGAILGYYVFHLQGAWRWIYVVTAVISLYLNVFVFVIQAFQKLAFLQPFAPTQSEPPFVVAKYPPCVSSPVWDFCQSDGFTRYHLHRLEGVMERHPVPRLSALNAMSGAPARRD